MSLFKVSLLQVLLGVRVVNCPCKMPENKTFETVFSNYTAQNNQKKQTHIFSWNKDIS